MTSSKRGGMQYLITRESAGGNAGGFRGKPCVGANFFFNLEKGEIREFTNDVQPCHGLTKGIFKLVMQVGAIPKTRFGCWFFKTFLLKKYPEIIGLYLPPKASKEARLNLELSRKMYNKMR